MNALSGMFKSLKSFSMLVKNLYMKSTSMIELSDLVQVRVCMM